MAIVKLNDQVLLAPTGEAVECPAAPTKPYIVETFSGGKAIQLEYYNFSATKKISTGISTSSLIKIIFGDGIAEIPYAYMGGLSTYPLEEAIIPDSVKKIGQQAFKNCNHLVIDGLPSNIETIDSNAFYGCSVLIDHLTIPATIKNINGTAFSGCTSLVSVTFEGTPSSTSAIYSNAFSNCPNITTINVPWAENAIKFAPWGATNATINYNYTGV